jgi:hypothetical protein
LNYYAKTNGFNANQTTYTFGKNPQNKWVAGGIGSTNTLAFSNDGIRWFPLGATIFTTGCYTVNWNGYLWVAGGQGTNSLAYSYDGIHWTPLGTSVFSTMCTNIVSNSTIFVAGGQGTNSLAYSYDGINWTPSNNSPFTSTGVVNSIAFNGLYWIAVGSNSVPLIAISTDGINWTTASSNPGFSASYQAVIWTGSVWVVGGSNGGAGAIAISYDNGSNWTQVSCPISSTVYGLATNGTRVIAIGSTSSAGTGNTLAYSSDNYATSWTGLGTALFNTTATNFQQIRWAINKFVAFSSDTTKRIAFSYDGITWNVASTASPLFSTAATAGDCSTALPHTITFPPNFAITGNTITYNNGVSWQTVATNPSISSAVGYNGAQFVYGNIPITVSNNQSVSLTSFGTDPTSITVIKWNGRQWLIGGKSPNSNQLKMSYDGYNWQTVASVLFTSGAICNGIAWSNSAWVASGMNAASTASILLYSADGQNWSQTSSTNGGGPVEWNGAVFLASNILQSVGTATIVSISQDGQNWSNITLATSSAGAITGIAASSTSTWVAITSTAIFASFNNLSWTPANTPPIGGPYTGVAWSGLCFIVSTTTNAVLYSYDGVNWQNSATPVVTGNTVAWSVPNTGTMNIQQPTIVGGQGNNTMAISADGVYYTGLGANIFTTSCNDIAWNGYLWVAGGQGTNTLAYSYDGQGWTPLGSAVFTTSCNRIVWNGTSWLALGSGGNTMATSTDGRNWTGLGATIFTTQGNSADWNGYAWVAGGQGSQNTLAYSNQPTPVASSWTGLGSNVLDQGCNTVRWMGNVWAVGGASSSNNQLAFSIDLTGQTQWTNSNTQIFSAAANSIFWNGLVAVAVGTGATNTLARSTDGMNWTGKGNQIFATSGFDVIWNTKRWIAVGSGVNTIAYSYDGSTWYPAPNATGIFTIGQSVGTNAKIGATVVPSGLYLTTNDKLSVNTPKWYDDALSSDTAISINLNLPT